MSIEDIIALAIARQGKIVRQDGGEIAPDASAKIANSRATAAAIRAHRCDRCDSIVRGVTRCEKGIALAKAHQEAVEATRKAVLG